MVNIFHLFPLILSLLLGCLALPGLAHADPLSLSANLSYNSTEVENEDTDWRFNQSYNLNLNREFTSSLSANADLRYNRYSASEGNDGQQFAPSAYLTLRNDIFTASLGGTASHQRPYLRYPARQRITRP